MRYLATEILAERTKTAMGFGTAARIGAGEFSQFMRQQHPEVMKALPGGKPPSVAWGHPILAKHLAKDPAFEVHHLEASMSPVVVPGSPLMYAHAQQLSGPAQAAIQKGERMGNMAVSAPSDPYSVTGITKRLRPSLVYNGSAGPLSIAAGSRRPAAHDPLQVFGHEMGHTYTIPGYHHGPRPPSLDRAVQAFQALHPEGAAEALRYGQAAAPSTGNPEHAELDADALAHHFNSALAERDPAAHRRLFEAFANHDAKVRHRNPADPGALEFNAHGYRNYVTGP